MNTVETLEALLVLPGSAGNLNFLIDSYIKRHAQKRLRTWRDIQAKLLRHVGFLGKKRLTDITVGDAEQLHFNIGENAPYEANRVIQHLKSAWNKGIAWGICPAPNPFASVTLFGEQARERFLSASEVRRLVTVAEKDNENVYDFIMLSLYTLARMSNILSMQWQDLDFEEKTWTIPMTKNGTKQTIPLGQEELQILFSRRQKYGHSVWVFPSVHSKCGHMTSPYRVWRRLLRRAQIHNCRIHDLRRSGAAAMACANVSVALIAAALNHKSVKTTLKVYAKTNKQAELEARQLARRLWFNRPSDQ